MDIVEEGYSKACGKSGRCCVSVWKCEAVYYTQEIAAELPHLCVHDRCVAVSAQTWGSPDRLFRGGLYTHPNNPVRLVKRLLAS